MSTTTQITWGDGFTEEVSNEWDKFKDHFLNTKIEAGKVEPEASDAQTRNRVWADSESANEWKTLAETFASEKNISVTVTVS